jgi:hypothetical protein
VAKVGYARVRTIDQDPALQLDALATAGCAKVFEDRASGARVDRPGLRAALDYVRDGDVLIVWELARLGRSLPHDRHCYLAGHAWSGSVPSPRQSIPPRPADASYSIFSARWVSSSVT